MVNTSTKPEKAKIINLETREEIDCLFNPKEYSFSKSNTWEPKAGTGKNVPQLEFIKGESMTLNMDLFFDTYATGNDVRKTTNKIWKLMNVSEKLTDRTSTKGRPPRVEFQWGSTWTFKAVITSLSQTFTLFRYDGIPVRATMKVSFKQVEEKGKYPGQNPTTIGQPGYRRRVVNEGDTIDWIAYDEYGDSAMWRFIADTNELDNPGRLRPGQILAIAPSP
jgi:hypothetical protein